MRVGPTFIVGNVWATPGNRQIGTLSGNPMSHGGLVLSSVLRRLWMHTLLYRTSPSKYLVAGGAHVLGLSSRVSFVFGIFVPCSFMY